MEEASNVLFSIGPLEVTGTVVTMWAIIVILTLLSWLATAGSSRACFAAHTQTVQVKKPMIEKTRPMMDSTRPIVGTGDCSPAAAKPFLDIIARTRPAIAAINAAMFTHVTHAKTIANAPSTIDTIPKIF